MIQDWLNNMPPLLSGLSIIVFGCIVGSFLNVVILRLPKMLFHNWEEEINEYFVLRKYPLSIPNLEKPWSLVSPPSSCVNCKVRIRLLDNVPIMSYLFLRGKCRQCSLPISVRYPLVELLTGIVTYIIYCAYPAGLLLFAHLILSYVLIILAFIDYDEQILPDQITLPMLWAGLLIPLFTNSSEALPEHLLGAVLGYLTLFIFYWTFKLITGKEGMGHGDFKLLAMLGAWEGVYALPQIILMASILGSIVGLLGISMKRVAFGKPIPFGPYLAFAGWLTLFWGASLNNWYVNHMLLG